MKIRLFILLFIITVLSTNIFAQTTDSPCANYIEVTGSSEMYVIPNEIYLSINLRTNETKDDKALAALETTLKKIIEKCGISQENLYVTDARSSENWTWSFFKQNVARSKKYTLKITDPNIVATVFEDLIDNGITDISIVKTSHSEMQEYRKQVKMEALKAAKEKASYLLESVNQSIGKLLYVKELSDEELFNKYNPGSNSSFSSNSSFYNIGMSTDSDSEYFVKIKIRYEIIARFEIK